jgi:very-short-patch-repair endonuclease
MLKISANNMVSGLEIHKAIESKNKRFDIWVKRVIEYADLEPNKDFCTVILPSTGGRPFTDYEFTIESSMLICAMNFNKNSKALKLYNYLSKLIGKEVFVELRTRKELLFEINLIEILSGITRVIPQYKVLNYRIDFYLPELNIAIEYDEKHHNSKKKSDKDRQFEIQSVLKCDFIRVSEYSEEKAINELLKLVLHKSLQNYEFTGDLSVYGEKLLSSINIKSYQEIENEKFIEILNQNQNTK